MVVMAQERYAIIGQYSLSRAEKMRRSNVGLLINAFSDSFRGAHLKVAFEAPRVHS